MAPRAGFKRRSLAWFPLWLLICASVPCVSPVCSQNAVPFPSQEWSVSTPEEQGVDSVRLASMLEAVETRALPIHSLLIVRNGVLVLEAHRYPHTAQTLHDIKSCTKSVISSLIGMGVARGFLPGIESPVVDFFPERSIANLDNAKRTITVAHLLTMSSGFDWPGGMLEQPVFSQLIQSPDWIGFVLDRPISDAPGARFVYNSGGLHLLSGILQKSAGMTAEEFAKAHLFAPLQIGRWYWGTDPQGKSIGGWGLWLRTQDLAKIGYLYLNGGRWKDSQLVPEAWVADSCRRQILAGGTWLSDGYGYQWWIDTGGYVMALGYAGQYLVLVPDRNLIMVVTSGLRLQDFFAPENLLTDFVLPASESDEPLSSNPSGVAALNERVAGWARPDSSVPVPPLPAMAWRISDRVYELAPSPVGWKTVSLRFQEGQSSGTFTADGVSYGFGLDGTYRATAPSPELQVPQDSTRMLRGRWTNSTTFVIDFFIVGRPDRYTETFHFQGETLILSEDVYLTGERFVTSGQALDRKSQRSKRQRSR